MAGPADQVARVYEVAQVELRAPVIPNESAHQVPIDTRSLTDPSRANGAGESALVDLKQ